MMSQQERIWRKLKKALINLDKRYEAFPESFSEQDIPQKKIIADKCAALFKQKKNLQVLNDNIHDLLFLFPFSNTVLNLCRKKHKKQRDFFSKEEVVAFERRKLLSTPMYRRALPELMAEFEFENSGLIDNAQIDGLHLWPIIRTLVCQQIEDKLLAKGRVLKGKNKLNTKAKKLECLGNNKIEFLENNYQYIHEKLRAEFLFFFREARFYRKEGSLWKGGMLEKLFLELDEKESCLAIEEFKNGSLSKLNRLISPLYFRTPWGGVLSRHILSKLGYKRKQSCKDLYICFLIYRKVINFFPILNHLQILGKVFYRLKYITAYAQVFNEVLRRIKPRAIFFELYYSPETMGLLLAAKQNKIATVEVQHGTMGRAQWLSTHWTYFPKNGFSILPDYFFVYDQFEKKNLERFQPEKIKFITGIPFGFLGAKKALESSSDDALYKNLHNNKYVILWINQYDSVEIDEVRKLALALPSQSVILYRLHPMLLPKAKEIEQYFYSQNITNVWVEKPSLAGLTTLLQYAQHLIARYSTVVREAMMFPINITLVDKVGHYLLSDFCDAGRLDYASDYQSLEQCILKKVKSGNTIAPKEQVEIFEHFKHTYLSDTLDSAVNLLRKDLLASPTSSCLNINWISIKPQPSSYKSRKIRNIYKDTFNYLTRKTHKNLIQVSFDGVLKSVDGFCFLLISFLCHKKYVESKSYLIYIQVADPKLVSEINNFISCLSPTKISIWATIHNQGILDDNNKIAKENQRQTATLPIKIEFTPNKISMQFVVSWLNSKKIIKYFNCLYLTSTKKIITVVNELIALLEQENQTHIPLLVFSNDVYTEIKNKFPDTLNVVDATDFNNTSYFQVNLLNLSACNYCFVSGAICLPLICVSNKNIFITDQEENSDVDSAIKIKSKFSNEHSSIQFFSKDASFNLTGSDTLFAIYDLDLSPVTYDICNFLSLAEIERQKRRLKHIKIITVPGKHSGFNKNKLHSNDEKMFRFNNILIPAFSLLPSYNGCANLNCRQDLWFFWENLKDNIFPNSYHPAQPIAYYSWRLVWEAYRRKNDVQKLKATDECMQQAKEWLKKNNLSYTKTITITLRESTYQVDRNSNLNSWLTFSEFLVKEGYQVILIRDFEKIDDPISLYGNNIVICEKASWDLGFRTALYEIAVVNFFINNGPWMLAVFNKQINHIAIKILTESVFVTSLKHRLNMLDDIGVSYPFLQRKQIFIWEDDEIEKLKSSFQKHINTFLSA